MTARNTLLVSTLVALGATALLVSGCDKSSSTEGDSRTASNDSVGAPQDVDPASDGDDSVASTKPATEDVKPPAPAPTVVFTLLSDGLPDEGMWKSDPVLTDIDLDGHVDLAALPRLGDGPRVWLGNSKGVWTESSRGLEPGDRSCGGGIAVGDVNNDGLNDLVVGDHCQGIFVYRGDGKGRWGMLTANLFPGAAVARPGREKMYLGAEDLDIGDVNEDGNLDIVAGSSDEGGLALYLGDGTGHGWEYVKTGLPTDGWANRVQVIDMNDDGHLDVLAAYSKGPRVWLGDGTGTLTASSVGLPEPTIWGLFRGIAAGDVNGDGRLDIAVANWVDGPEVYYQMDGCTWLAAPDVYPELLGGSVGLDMGDLDLDGNLDIVISGRMNQDGGFVRGVFALLGDGKGGWTPLLECGLPDTGLGGMDGVAIGDVTGDGRPDVAAGSGLHVETSNIPAPVIPQRLLVWEAHDPSEVSVEKVSKAPDGE